MNCGIYCLTSPSGKSYVGQSTNILNRLKSYKRLHCKNQTKLYNSLKKYGFDNFKIVILEECSIHELNEFEEFWIKYFETITTGYNLKSGGDRTIHSEETRKKLSISAMGHKRNVGKIRSDSVKKKLSEIKRLSVKSESHLKNIKISKRKSLDWGISNYKNTFHVKFKQNGIVYYKGRFPTIDIARNWRDAQKIY